MLKMLTRSPSGKDVVVLGLSRGNLLRLASAPIHIKRSELKIGVDIVIYAQDMGEPKRLENFMFIGLDTDSIERLPTKILHLQNEHLPVDVILFAGETEQEMGRAVADLIGPDIEFFSIDPRLRD